MGLDPDIVRSNHFFKYTMDHWAAYRGRKWTKNEKTTAEFPDRV